MTRTAAKQRAEAAAGLGVAIGVATGKLDTATEDVRARFATEMGAFLQRDLHRRGCVPAEGPAVVRLLEKGQPVPDDVHPLAAREARKLLRSTRLGGVLLAELGCAENCPRHPHDA